MPNPGDPGYPGIITPQQVGFPVIEPDVFGPIVGADDVRDAVRDTIKQWSPVYIAEMAARSDQPLVPFRHWETLYQYRELGASDGPACWVTCAGTFGEPQRQGNGNVKAVWIVDTHVVVYGLDWAETADLTAKYVKTVRALLLQQSVQPVTGTDGVVRWISESYAEVAHEARRSLGVGVSRFHITVDAVVNTAAGPFEVPVQPLAAGGETVDSVSITITKE